MTTNQKKIQNLFVKRIDKVEGKNFKDEGIKLDCLDGAVGIGGHPGTQSDGK